MENKLINERIAEFINYLESTNNDYIFITSIEGKDKASFRGQGVNLLAMLAYGLKTVVEITSKQDGAPSKPVLLDEAINSIAGVILKAWKEEEEKC